jgi:hypothetical protein
LVLCGVAASSLVLSGPAFAGEGHGKHAKDAAKHAPGSAQAGDDHGRHGDPGGNNGTVKVDGQPYDDGKGNEAHVGCQFRLKFYGFDADQHANITFDAHAPSGSGVLQKESDVLISDDAAGGGQDLDAIRYYDASTWDLSGLTAKKQGYHVKLSVDVLEAPGGAKHKVFWINCAPAAPTTSGTATEGTGSGTGTSTGTSTGGGSGTVFVPPATTGTSTSTTGTAGSGATKTTTGAVSTTTTASAAQTPAAVTRVLGIRHVAGTTHSSTLPFTGSPVMRMLLLALTLLTAGGLVLGAVGYAARRASRT